MNYIKKVFKILNQQIKYCHFKSNEHLKESFAGKTDFDLLIYRKDIYKFQFILNEFGFKRRISSTDKQYFGMEDYIGFDSKTGKLYHFHIHYQIIVGKKLNKNYVLNFEKILWNNLKFIKEFEIYIPIPEIELIILTLRICLKMNGNIKNVVKILIHKPLIPINIWNEFDYLVNQISKKKIEEMQKKIDIDQRNFRIFLSLLKQKKTNNLFFLRTKKKLLNSLSIFSILSNPLAQHAKRTKMSTRILSGSWLSTVGTTIAFIGCDGAGKSTVVRDINKWLSWKLSIKQIYMGKPKKYPVHIKILEKFEKLFKRIKFQRLGNALNEQTHLYNAKIRLKNFLTGERMIRSGNIVLFDRFPLKEFWNMKEPMDGPKILINGKNKNKERKIYTQIKEPTLIFILDIEVEESMKRKKNQGIIEDKKAIVNKFKAVQEIILEKSYQENLYVFNTMESYDIVLLKIKRKIWELI